jgi:hypothetical protein
MMRLPRMLFTVRRLMVASVAIAVICAYSSRWTKYRRLASAHENIVWFGEPEPQPGWIIFHERGHLSHWHKALEYRRAAWFPWIRVEPYTFEPYPPESK